MIPEEKHEMKNPLAFMKQFDFIKKISWKKAIPDIEDAFAFIGLVMAGIGLWQKYDWTSFIVIGFILFGLGLIRSFR